MKLNGKRRRVLRETLQPIKALSAGAKIILALVVLFALIAAVEGIKHVVGVSKNVPHEKVAEQSVLPTHHAPPLPHAGETAQEILAVDDAYGSEMQVRYLLALRDKRPGYGTYEITLISRDAEKTEMIWDVRQDFLIRKHENNGRGTAESWTGYVEYRLQAAQTGGSLNDTPLGKIPGTFTVR